MANKITEWNMFQQLKGIGVPCDFGNKEQGIRQYVTYMLSRTQQMFKWENLPESLPHRDLELLLQCNGFACVTKVDGDLYAFYGGLGGEYNAYYRPTRCVVSNPYLNFSKELKIDEDCVIILNDAMYQGLLPMFNRYATMLAENDVTIRLADINARLINIISAGDSSTYESAKDYIDKIEKGQLGIIGENSFILDGVKVQPSASSGNNMIQLIELQQYLKGSWFEDIGLQASFNMKREALNSSETSQDDDILLPLADNMLECRKLACEKINAMFGTNISVDFNSAWLNNHIEVENHVEETETDDSTDETSMEDNQDRLEDMEDKSENQETSKED